MNGNDYIEQLERTDYITPELDEKILMGYVIELCEAHK